MQCQKCQFECEGSDAFCRKCGSALVQEAAFREISVEVATDAVIQITPTQTIEIDQTNTNLPVKQERGKLSRLSGGLARRAANGIGKIANSEQGKRVMQSAITAAAAVGTEMVVQALAKVSRSDKPAVTPANNSSAKNVAEGLAKAVEDKINQPTPKNANKTEVFYRERIYYKRIIRKDE